MTRSNVVLLARVDDPIQQVTRTTRSTIVMVEHEPGEALTTVVEMAIELAPAVTEWTKT